MRVQPEKWQLLIINITQTIRSIRKVEQGVKNTSMNRLREGEG